MLVSQAPSRRGETYEENIKKEAWEELGITEELTKGPKVRLESQYNLFIQWFFLTLNRSAESFKFQTSKIEQVKWYAKDELIEAIKKEPEKFMANGRDMTRWIDLFWK